jgi:hypothetical protein
MVVCHIRLRAPSRFVSAEVSEHYTAQRQYFYCVDCAASEFYSHIVLYCSVQKRSNIPLRTAFSIRWARGSAGGGRNRSISRVFPARRIANQLDIDLQIHIGRQVSGLLVYTIEFPRLWTSSFVYTIQHFHRSLSTSSSDR